MDRGGNDDNINDLNPFPDKDYIKFEREFEKEYDNGESDYRGGSDDEYDEYDSGESDDEYDRVGSDYEYDEDDRGGSDDEYDRGGIDCEDNINDLNPFPDEDYIKFEREFEKEYGELIWHVWDRDSDRDSDSDSDSD